MKNKRFALLSIMALSMMLVACGAAEAVETEGTESQVAETVVEESVEAGAEASEEATESNTEAAEENLETETEAVTEEIPVEDAMASIEEILAQAQQEAMEAARQEVMSQDGTEQKEYDFPEGYDSEKYTWRQTTADRDLYWMEGDKELIGKEFIGETFEEILQMAEDPTCDFDEENFWNATCFKGLTIEDTKYLVSKGYNVDQLINMVIENGVGNVYELNIWE